MTCYRVNWRVTREELTELQDWLHANKEQAGVIGMTARQGINDDEPERSWFTKFVFSTEVGVRMFYRKWDDCYSDEFEIRPWR